MILKTNAIVLQIRQWSKTSHMVTWLTEDYGRVTTAVKGACRPKSAFLGQYDLFYSCEILFYRKCSNGVHAIRECYPLEFREELRSNWRGAAAAGYITNMTARVTAGQDTKGIYDDLLHALDTLCECETRSIESLIFWFELRLLRHHGISPQFGTCAECHPTEQEWLRFSIPAGRFICSHLHETHSNTPSVSLHKDVVTFLRRFAKCDKFIARHYTPILASKNKNEKKINLILGLSRFLGIFIVYHLDLPASVRRTTFEILNTNPASL